MGRGGAGSSDLTLSAVVSASSTEVALGAEALGAPATGLAVPLRPVTT